MGNSIKLVRILVLTIFVVILSCNAFPQNNVSRKVWKFKSNHGALTIIANTSINESGKKEIALSIDPNNSGTWTVSEEAASLSHVLDEFPKAGFDIRHLASIRLRMDEPDAQQLIATEAAISKLWKLALKSKNPDDTDPAVVALINDSNAYDDWKNAFNQRGLEVKAVGVENVELAAFSKSGAACPIGGNCDKLLVPTSAVVQMNVIHLVPQ